jgi:hypothetical protein
MKLGARLRRQRLRTWLARRALAAQLQVSGSESAGVDLVARVRSRVIGRTTLQLVGGEPHAVQISLTMQGSRRLRDAGRARVVLTAVATDAAGRRSSAVSRVRPG